MSVSVDRSTLGRTAGALVDDAEANGWEWRATEAEGEYRGKPVASLLMKFQLDHRETATAEFVDGKFHAAYAWSENYFEKIGARRLSALLKGDRSGFRL